MSDTGHDWASRRARHAGQPVPEGLKHGSNSYARRIYACGCELCLPSGKRTWRYRNDETRALTHAERQSKYRAGKYGTTPPPHIKHGVSTYQIYGCRCSICREAVSVQRAKKKNAWRENARGHWTSDGTVDTICWPPNNAGPDWVCPHNHQEVA